MNLGVKTQNNVYICTHKTCRNSKKTTKTIAEKWKLAREPEEQWEAHTYNILKLRREKR